MVLHESLAAIDTFLASPAAQALADVPSATTRTILRGFLDCVHEEAGRTPAELDGDTLHFVVGHLLPARFAIGDPLAEQAGPVLAAYLSSLELPAAQASELTRALEGTLGEFREAVRTGAAVHHMGHQHESGEQPFVRAATKVGRNDPCPCGSGRKFKQCCA